jgi:hypothetical protein
MKDELLNLKRQRLSPGEPIGLSVDSAERPALSLAALLRAT